MLEKTDYVGLVSGTKTDKSKLFTLFYSEQGNIPMIEECPVCVECKLENVVENGSNEMFIGDITGIYTEEIYTTNGAIDFLKINPVILSQSNIEYWSLGEKIGRAWEAGKNIKSIE